MVRSHSIALLPAGSPFLPDSVLAPRLLIADHRVDLSYPAADCGATVQVTFEGVDAVRRARGEASPYPAAAGSAYAPVAIVRPSAWLRERHAYEAEHYGDTYEWGRGADTMLVDTHHHLFVFHDEFVEVLARGAWFERFDGEAPAGATLRPGHPGHPLSGDPVEAGRHGGIDFAIRASTVPAERLLAGARLHSQPMFELFLDGNEDRPTLVVRVRADAEHGGVRAWVIGSYGPEIATFDRIPTLDDVAPVFRAWLTDLARRREEIRTGRYLRPT